MTKTVQVAPGEYGLLVHENNHVDLLVHNGDNAIPTPLAALVGAHLLLQSDEDFLDECLTAFRLYVTPSANEVPA